LRPKQLFIVDINKQINDQKTAKSWRGEILKFGDILELQDKPDEGIFLDNVKWITSDSAINQFELTDRYRIEGRTFVLCTGDLAYGHLRLGEVTQTDEGSYIYEIEKFDVFENPIKLDIPDDEEGLFVENIENYYKSVEGKPIPKPRPREPEKEFIGRCMSNDTMVNEYPDTDQRYAICQSQWRNRKDVDNVKDEEVENDGKEKEEQDN
jgi:hypothetical protein